MSAILLPPRVIWTPDMVDLRPMMSVVGRAMGFMRSGGVITQVYSDTLPSDNTGNHTYSFRKAITPSAGGATQVRVTFKSATTGTFVTNNCSIAVKGTATLPSTQAAPTELKFSAASGFNLAANSTITSDWLTFTFTGSDILVIVIDFGPTGGTGNCSYNGSGTNSTYYKAATASYNTASVSGYTTYGAAPEFGVSKIEVL